MPVPNVMADLSTLAGSNSPAGTEVIGNSLDNYLRAQAAILRSTNALSSSTLAAASTVDLATSDAESVQVTGSATINSLGTGFNGCRREVRFSGVCTLVNSANIVLPGGANITTSAGDVLAFRCIGSGVWALVGASGRPLPYTPVNKAGDTMLGGLTVTESANAPAAVVRVNNPNNGSGAATGYYFGNDLDASFAAYILKNSSGNTAFGGPASLNVINAQAAPLTWGTGGVVRGSMSGAGDTSWQGAMTVTNSLGIPAGAGGGAWEAGGFASPIAGRKVFGDGTGWQYRWARRSGGAYTDVMTLTDSGVVSPLGLQIGGTGFTATKLTVSSSAPGTLAQGEIYFQY